MKVAGIVATGLALAGFLALSGCVGAGGGNANRYATACMAEVNPPGAYVWRDGDDKVLGGKFATREGIEAMNACINRKAAASGADQRSEVAISGNTVVETYTYGEPPASKAATGAAKPKQCRERNVFSGGTGYNQCIR